MTLTAKDKRLTPKVLQGVKIVLFELGHLKSGERCCIVSDDHTAYLGNAFWDLATARGSQARHMTIRPMTIHGEEPDQDVACEMKRSHLVVGLTTYSMAHTQARYEACQAGARYLSLPDYSDYVLSHPSLHVDFQKEASRGKRLAEQLTAGRFVRIKTPRGTDIELNITDRTGNFCPGYVQSGMPLGSPPDIESNVAPVEGDTNGVVVVDGSIPGPGLGLLASPVTLTIRQGMITQIAGRPRYQLALEQLFTPHGPKGRVLAEFGIGLNPKALVCGNMLIDEGCLGTFHFGFGSNATIGGKNSVKFHLDFIFYADSFWLDGNQIFIKK